MFTNDWIDKRIPVLASAIGCFRSEYPCFHFEPTPDIYSLLGSGDDEDLCAVCSQLVAYLELPSTPIIRYQWGITMAPNHAGQVKLGVSDTPISIPFYYAGKPYLMGAIIAHELAHVFMSERRIQIERPYEYEPMTDLTAVCMGLGKLILNGTLPKESEDPHFTHNLGYVPHAPLLYAFQKVNEIKQISQGIAKNNLRAEISL